MPSGILRAGAAALGTALADAGPGAAPPLGAALAAAGSAAAALAAAGSAVAALGVALADTETAPLGTAPTVGALACSARAPVART